MFLKRQAALLILAGVLAMPVASIAAESAETAPESAVFSGGGEPVFSSFERRVVARGVAEYSFKLRVGRGQYDVIGIHRVVKESAPNVPAPAAQAVFLAHGDLWGFRPAFLGDVPAVLPLPGPTAPSLPVFLAQNGVDVWGIDFRWTLVPGGLPDYSFMQSWGLTTDAADLGTAIGAARFARAAGGNGFGQVTLLGWSRGGQIGYAYLDAESQLPAGLRQVKGFIPADIYLKTDVQQFRRLACSRQADSEGYVNGGTYANPIGAQVASIGNAALVDPNGAPAPGYPTNRQMGLIVGAKTYDLQGGKEPVPVYHMTGGTFDATPAHLPTGLLYTGEQALFKLEQAASPVQPFRELAEADASTCEQTDVPFDDHLADITVPVLYVGAGGGFGDSGLYTTSLLGSADVTSHIVSLSAQRESDFGHADLFQATNAQSLVWQPILTWLQAH